MLFLFLTTIGVSLVLQQKIRQEYEGSSELLDKHQALKRAKGELTIESAQLDEELDELFAQHQSLVAKRDGICAPSLEEYREAMEELERDLSIDPLDAAFYNLERSHDEKKKKGL